MHCSSKKTQDITDVIDVVRLSNGQKDTVFVSDLFYAPKYDLKFFKNDHIAVKYSPGSKYIVFTPDDSFVGLTVIKFKYNSQWFHIPVSVKKRIPYTFKYRPRKKVESVRVIGSFNTWNRKSIPMEDPDGDGTFEKIFWLDAGRYEYRFYINGKDEIIDPKNKSKIMNSFGEYNSQLIIKENKITPRLVNRGYQKKESTIQISYYIDSENAGPITNDNVICLKNNVLVPTQSIRVNKNVIQVTLGRSFLEPNTTIRTAVTGENFATPFEQVIIKNGDIAGSDPKSFSWHDAIVYSIVVDRFFDGDTSNTQKVNHPQLKDKANYYGGDLQGVMQKLDEGYFTDLGINVLWLSPLNQTPLDAYQEYPEPHRFYSGYHGYWPIDPTKLDTRFGTMELLQELVEKAHQKNIKVILDYVSNHVHEEHPFFKEHRSWFGTLDLPDGRKNLRLWDEYRLTTWFEPYLPSFDYLGSETALKTMTDNAVWWLKESNADGFRQDAVKHVPSRFWRTLTRKINSQIEQPENRKIFQIGESFGSYALTKSYVNNGQLDAQFNFNLYNTALYAFLNPEAGFDVLDGEMSKTFENYGMFHLMGNLMDSHDKIRFLALADGDIPPGSNPAEIAWNDPPKVDSLSSYKLAQVYMTYLMTIPGIPFVYYGDEFGMTGSIDPDNRRPMRFGADLTKAEQQMKKKIKSIINLRRDNTALRYGDFKTIYVDKDIYAYVRSDMHQKVLVVLSKSRDEKIVGLNFSKLLNVKSVIPLFGVKRYSLIHNVLDVTVAPLSSMVFLLH